MVGRLELERNIAVVRELGAEVGGRQVPPAELLLHLRARVRLDHDAARVDVLLAVVGDGELDGRIRSPGVERLGAQDGLRVEVYDRSGGGRANEIACIVVARGDFCRVFDYIVVVSDDVTLFNRKVAPYDAVGDNIRDVLDARRDVRAQLGPVGPAVLVGVLRRVVEAAVVAVLVLKVVLHEVVVSDEFADVVLLAVDSDRAEVVDRLAVGLHRRDIQIKAVGEGPIFLDVGKPVVVAVGELRLGSLEAVLPRVKVGERGRNRVGVPWIGRSRALEFADQGQVVAVVVGLAVVEVPGADGRPVREVHDVHSVRAEHDVEFPAVRRAVLVVVDVKWLERILRPLAVDVDIVLVADAERGEVADQEVLVERRERLRVDGGLVCVRSRIRRLRIKAELIVDLRMDERDHSGRNCHDAVGRSGCRHEVGHKRTTAIAVHQSVFSGNRIVVDLVELIALNRVAADRHVAVVLEDVVDGFRAVRVLHRHDSAGVSHERHHVAVSGFHGVEERRVEVGELDLPAVRHAVAVGVPDRRIGRKAVLFLIQEAVAIAVTGRAFRTAGGEDGLDAVENLVAVEVRVFDVDDDGRAAQYLVGDLDALRREEREGLGADVVRIAPRFVNVALAVVVRVDVGHQVDGSRLDAGKFRVGGLQVVPVCELRDVGAHLGERLTGEVGRLVNLNDDESREVVRVGAIVPDDRTALAVARGQPRVDVFVRNVHLELRPGAPELGIDVVVLRVELRDAPEVVAAVEEDRGAVRDDWRTGVYRRREGVAEGPDCKAVAAGELLDSGIVDDVRGIRRGRDLETEGRHRVVRARPGEGRRGAVNGCRG